MRIHKRKVKISSKLRKSKSKYEIKTDKDDPKLPGIFVFSGSRGSGKTYAAVMMVKDFEKKGYITRTFLLCPTKLNSAKTYAAPTVYAVLKLCACLYL